jgi:ribonuclease HI
MCKPGGQHVISCSWGLGSMTNNEAEALALFTGIHLAQSEGIQKLVVCGDSMMIIRALVKGPIVGSNFLSRVMFYHVLLPRGS